MVVVVVVVVVVGVGVVLVVFVVVLPISTSAPSMVCFVHFDFNMCFAPQLRAFSTSQLPKLVQTFGVLAL